MILHNFPDYINPKCFILIITFGNYINFSLSSGIVFGIQYLVQPEKAMATQSSTLDWKIPWTEGPGRLQSMGSLGVRHD